VSSTSESSGDRQTDRQTERERDRQRDRERQRERQRETELYRERHTHIQREGADVGGRQGGRDWAWFGHLKPQSPFLTRSFLPVPIKYLYFLMTELSNL
jgi:hypothetical protein